MDPPFTGVLGVTNSKFHEVSPWNFCHATKTCKNCHRGRSAIFGYNKHQIQINQQIMQNLMKLQDLVQQVSYVLRRKGEEYLNKEFSYRYLFSRYKDASKKRVHS